MENAAYFYAFLQSDRVRAIFEDEILTVARKGLSLCGLSGDEIKDVAQILHGLEELKYGKLKVQHEPNAN